MPTIRLATEADASGVHTIYAPIVCDTIISFEYEVPSSRRHAQPHRQNIPRYPWLICEQEGEDGEMLGYAYASLHSERAAYNWSANVSVYVSAPARRMGVGKALYGELFARLRAQNIVNVYAGITLPNPAASAFTRQWA